MSLMSELVAPETAPPLAPAPAGRDPARHRAIAAIRAFLSSHTASIGRMTAATFEIADFAQAERLATMLAMHYPDPERAALGIWELLANAIEHGSLGIGCAEKADLLRRGDYEAELRRRLADPARARQRVRVAFRRGKRALTLTITDEGAGFDHRHFLALDGDAAPNGRGIRIARDISFDGLAYAGRGNRVTARTRLPAEPVVSAAGGR